MTTELNDFFKLLSSEKKEKKNNLKQKIEIVDEVSLKNLFSSLVVKSLL